MIETEFSQPDNTVAGLISTEEERLQRLRIPILEFGDEDFFGELRLPLVWITKPFWDTGTQQVVGRAHIADYVPIDDPYGYAALNYGSEYYQEGFDYPGADQRDQRIDCFRAAEALYLHALQLGNVQAMVNLGYLYLYNRLEHDRQYWECYALAQHLDICTMKCDACEHRFPREQRALEYFRKAHERGNLEASYKLGDLYAQGRGCKQDLDKAFTLYAEAYPLSKHDDASVWGSLAHRLASCYENASGTNLDFEKALEYYQIAKIGFEAAIREGFGYYEKNLSNTRKAIKRMQQELSANY